MAHNAKLTENVVDAPRSIHYNHRRMKIVAHYITCALLSLVVASAYGIPGQPGTLDTSWGPNGNGQTTTDFGGMGDSVSAMALQPNGKAVIAGVCQSSTSLSFCALRYNRDGTLDTTFGTNGKTITTVVSDSDSAQALTLQNDGKIVLAGSCRNGASFDFCAVRYNSDGSIDTSFATNGKLLLTIGSGGVRLTTIAVQRDEKLILIGDCNTSSNGDFCAARFHPNGILDTSFGVNGIVITQVGAGFDYSKASTVQPDGKILVAGGCQRVGTSAICLVRYNMDGLIDSSFAGTGKLIEPVGTSFAQAIELQQDGKILVAGYCHNAANTPIFCVARYNADASIDASFGTAGKVLTEIENLTASARALKIQSDGKIIISGGCYNRTVAKFCAARYNTNGSLDTSFAGTGTIATVVGSGNSGGAVLALQPDGKILLSGTCYDPNANGVSNVFCTVRYDGGPNTPKILIEYVYNSLNYYFLTSRDTDKTLLDATAGWARTGQSFSSLSFADPGSMGINRYYFDRVAKNQTRGSHFYTLVDSEKTALAALNLTNQLSPRLPYNEGIDSYASLPVVEGVGGRCAAGQTPVYRVFRGQSRFPDDPNHRFTTSLTLYNQLVAQGWDGEGVKICTSN